MSSYESKKNVPMMAEHSTEKTTDLNKGRGTGFIRSCYNATAAFLGVGILSLPYAVSRGGWLSIMLFPLICFLSFRTAIMLERCMQMQSDHRPMTSYQDMADRAFGRKGRFIACFVSNFELYLIAIGLLVMEGDNLSRLFPHFIFKYGGHNVEGKSAFVIITSLIIFPSLLITDLRVLSYLSAIGLYAISALVISVLCIGASGNFDFPERSTLFRMSGIPTCLNLFIVCFGGHSVLPSVYKSMENQNQFGKVMSVTFLFSTITYLLMAITGYLMYGKHVQPQITLNLPTKILGSKIAIYSTLVIPVTRYALMLAPIANGIESGLLGKYRQNKLVRLLTRMLLLTSSTVIACEFPYFEFLMAVTGSVSVVAVSLLLPCCCYLKISGIYKEWSYELIGIAAIILFGSVSGLVGTYFAVAEVYHHSKGR